jgi:hypothetical protein
MFAAAPLAKSSSLRNEPFLSVPIFPKAAAPKPEVLKLPDAEKDPSS